MINLWYTPEKPAVSPASYSPAWLELRQITTSFLGTCDAKHCEAGNVPVPQHGFISRTISTAMSNCKSQRLSNMNIIGLRKKLG